MKISVAEKPDSLTGCNCSICHRYGSLWGYYPPEEVSIQFESEASRAYSWGDKNIDFHHCGRCGCVTHYVTTEKVSKPKVGVNFRMAEAKEVESIKIRKLDGADSWEYLD
ncbi:MAG: aldehyde-activating protein [Gammaproteobacteria bacterium]|nr:aldehyde-activating protein [Gammaproteobacteria bacterium]